MSMNLELSHFCGKIISPRHVQRFSCKPTKIGVTFTKAMQRKQNIFLVLISQNYCFTRLVIKKKVKGLSEKKLGQRIHFHSQEELQTSQTFNRIQNLESLVVLTLKSFL